MSKIKFGMPENQSIGLVEIAATYFQEKDSCKVSDEPQSIEISTQDAGGGLYFIIKTDRWAFDKIEDLIVLLKDFERRAK